MVDSTIRVAIIGDAKGLSKALRTGEKDVAGFGGSIKKLGLGLGVGLIVGEVLDFMGDALDEADRLGDAMTRLELNLSDLAGQLIDTADEFAFLGQSTQDILELEAAFADAGTAAQLTKTDIAGFAEQAAATAAAVALLTDQDAATVIDLIGKAGLGSEKALRALGISITDAEVEARALADTGKTTAESLTASELAGARFALVLEALKPKLDAVTQGTADVEQKQGELQATWETLTGEIGQGLEGPITDLLTAILAGVRFFVALEEQMKDVQQEFKNALAPIGAVANALADVLDLLVDVGSRGLIPNFTGGGGTGSGAGGGFGSSGGNKPTVNLNVVPRDSQDTERAVIAALRDYTARSGRLE